MPQAMKILEAKAAVEQQKRRWTRIGKIGENFGVEADESQK